MTKRAPVKKKQPTSRQRAVNPMRVIGRTIESMQALAYEKLGVKPEDVAILPRITHIIERLDKKPAQGISRAVEFLRGSAEDDARRFLKNYDDLSPTQHKLIPFEAFCLASDLTTKRVLELITGACFEQSANTSALMSAASHPDVVSATIKSAKNVMYGKGDREMLHKHAGFIPVPKNQTTIISGGGVQNNIDQSKNQTISIGEVIGIEDKMARISNRFNETLGLGEGKSMPLMPLMLSGADEGSITETVASVQVESMEEDWD